LRRSRERSCAANPDNFNRLLGVEYVDVSPELMSAHLPVAEKLLQPYGLVHGGVYAAVAETLASMGTAVAVHERGEGAVGMSNHTTFLRPVTKGTIHATARPRHRGRTTWVWDVECADDDGRVCAISRVTIAVRPMQAPG